jgi:hypothetical protein
MAYLTNMPQTCRSRATNPEFALTLLDSIKQEFDKSFNGGIFDASYVLQKLQSLTTHVEWLEQEAISEFAAQCEPEGDLCGKCGSELRSDGEGCTSCEAESVENMKPQERGTWSAIDSWNDD